MDDRNQGDGFFRKSGKPASGNHCKGRNDGCETNYRELVDFANAIILRWNVDGVITFINDYAVRFFGYAREEIIGKNVLETIIPPVDTSGRDLSVMVQEICSRPAHFIDNENENVTKDGTRVWIKWCNSGVFDTEGSISGIISVGIDISAKKRADEQQKKNENILGKIIELLPVGLWIADKDGVLLSANEMGAKIWGAEPHVGLDDYGVFKARRLPSGEEIAPDDWALAHSVREGVTITDELLEIDTFDGAKKTILNFTAPVIDETGSIQAAIVVNQDITARVKAEEALQISRNNLRTIFDNAHDAIFIHDLFGGIIDVNAKMLDMYRVEYELALKLTIQDDYSALDNPLDELPERWKKVVVGETITFDWNARRPLDGSIFPVIVRLQKLNLAGSDVVMASVTDVTELKKAENVLRESEQRSSRQRTALASLAVDQALVEYNLYQALEHITEVVSDAIGVARVSIWRLVNDDAELRCITLFESGNKTHHSGDILDPATFPSYFKAIKAENRVYAEDAQNDSRTRELTEDYLLPLSITSLLDAGIVVDGRLVGIVSCEHVGEKRKWYSDEESFASTIAAIVAQLFVNTERRRMEDVLRESERRASKQRTALAELAIDQALVAADLPHALELIAAVLSDTLDVARSSVWKLSENDTKLECLSLFDAVTLTYNGGTVLDMTTFPVYFKTITTENLINTEDVQNDPRTRELTDDYLKPLGIVSMLDAGIFIEGKLIGVVCCEHVGKTRKWYSDEESFVTTIAAIVAQLFTNIERKKTEDALRKSEEKYRKLIDATGTGYVIVDAKGIVLDANEQYCQMIGYDRLDLIVGRNVLDWTSDAMRDKNAEAIEICREQGYIRNLEVEYIRSDGTIVPVDINSRGVMTDTGIQFLTLCRDITERKQAENNLAESEANLREEQNFRQLLLDTSPAFIVAISGDGKVLMMNQALLETLEYTAEEIDGVDYQTTIVPEEDRDSLFGVFSAIRKGIKETVNENRIRTKSGKTLLVEWHGRAVMHNTDTINFIVGVGIDITERRTMEIALRDSEEKYRNLFDSVNDAILVQQSESMHSPGLFIAVNEAACHMLGYPRDELLALSLSAITKKETGENDLVKESYALLQKYGVAFVERIFITKNGREVPVELNMRSFNYRGKNTVLTAARNISDRKRAEEKLRASEERNRSIVESLPDIFFQIDSDYRFIDCQASRPDLLLLPKEQFIGKTVYETLPPDLACLTTEKVKLTLESGLMQIYEYSLDMQGERRYYEARMTPIVGTGSVLAIERDITMNKRAEAEREKLEDQLLQSQKMEAVGRLAGGVAHDFNNMLSVIVGNVEIAMMQVDRGLPLFDALEEIRNAADRSAALTRQLLAFARKQTIAPKVLDLNETVEGMLKMLHRLIGEDISLQWKPGYNLRRIKIDPTQIDQILANLCVNARDAINDVGTITIETANQSFDADYCASHAEASAGDYILLAVSDDGIGMNKETLDSLFEPFFTTKERGKGTGLGLATVYGIVKQNNGFISVYSEVGSGTTFNIYLPAYIDEACSSSTEISLDAIIGGKETILLVEDDPSILKVSNAMLASLGYTVLPVNQPAMAVEIAGTYEGEIHLLITDVVMPEMNGRELAGLIMTLRPKLKRLFMSGYTENVIAHRGVLDEGVNFMHKPFTRKDLARKIREALDR